MLKDDAIRSVLADKTFRARFERHTTKTATCWLWSGCVDRKDYGVVCIRYRLVRAHRVAFSLASLCVPTGLCVCHSCDNPRCVRPSHLWTGTNADNIADKVRKGRARGASICGERNGASKITSSDSVLIRKRAASGERQRIIAAEFGISQQHVSEILRGNYW